MSNPLLDVLTEVASEQRQRRDVEFTAERIRKEEDARRVKEQGERSARTRSPAPPHQGPYDPRWPMQTVVELHPPPPRDAGGAPPEIDGRSEADKLRDPAFLLARIGQLEARVARLEDITERQLGTALNVDGPVYR